MKRRYNSKYLMQPSAAQILVNIATSHFYCAQHMEAVKFFKLALDVLNNSQAIIGKTGDHSLYLSSVAEKARVCISLVRAYRKLNFAEETEEYSREAKLLVETYLQESEMFEAKSKNEKEFMEMLYLQSCNF